MRGWLQPHQHQTFGLMVLHPKIFGKNSGITCGDPKWGGFNHTSTKPSVGWCCIPKYSERIQGLPAVIPNGVASTTPAPNLRLDGFHSPKLLSKLSILGYEKNKSLQMQALCWWGWRRDRDSNPGSRVSGTTVFETAPFDRSGISPISRTSHLVGANLTIF